MKCIPTIGLIAALAMHGAAFAQEAPATGPSALASGAMKSGPSLAPPSEDEVIVTGRKQAEPAEVRRQAHDITPTPSKLHEPLAMFQDSVCPGIVGMPVDMAEVMVDRIRRNAERVGITNAPLGDCQPNILVIFVRNGQATLKQLRDDRSWLFQGIAHSDFNDMVADSGPVHAWVNTEVRSRQGDRLQTSPSDRPDQIPTLNIGSMQSRIILAHQLNITNSVILIDIPAIDGMSVVQIADYVTMRALVQTKPVSGEAAAGTILNLFDRDANTVHPRELTDFDLAYLRAVYDGWRSLNAMSKIAQVNEKLKEIQDAKLAAADAGD